MSSCIKLTTKKYNLRPGPPFPANKCQHKVKVGNDGKHYKSVTNKNGVFTWRKSSKKSSIKKRSKKRSSKKRLRYYHVLSSKGKLELKTYYI